MEEIYEKFLICYSIKKKFKNSDYNFDNIMDKDYKKMTYPKVVLIHCSTVFIIYS